MAISSPLQSKVPAGSTRTIKKLQGILLNRTKVKREIFQRQTILQNRREENERRKQREDELEAPNRVTRPRGPAKLISGSAKGFFDRLIGFLGYLTAGWIINNLPTWIAMGKEFIARTQQMGKILGGFITNSTDIFKDFTRLLGATLTNIMTFDFLDTSGRVKTAFDELNLSVDNWGTGFEDAIKLLTTPLTEGIASGENAPATGTEITDEGAYEPTAPYSGSGGGTVGTKEQRAMLDAISYSEGTKKSYGTIYGGKVVPELERGELTVGQVLEMQKTGMLNGKSVGYVKDRYNSDATGRYQFMSYTLREEIGKQGISLNEKFTPALQDKIILNRITKMRGVTPELLKKEGLSAKVSNMLSPEFASLPTYSGVSYYGQPVKPLKSIQNAYQQSLGTQSTQAQPTPAQRPRQSTPTRIVQVPPGKINPIIGDRLGAGRNHGGIDLLVDNGTPLKAISDGMIVDSDFEKNWGNFLVMKDNLGIYHLYGHMQSGYKRSGPVKKGEVIGKVGMTGRTSGPHLHWEAGTGWNGYVITGRFDPINKGYSKFAPFNTSYSESAAPSQTQLAPKPQTPPPAQITPTGTQQRLQASQQLTPERTGPTVIVSETPPSSPQQIIYSGGGGSSGVSSPQISEFTLLNNFMRNKLLLDLAYL